MLRAELRPVKSPSLAMLVLRVRERSLASRRVSRGVIANRNRVFPILLSHHTTVRVLAHAVHCIASHGDKTNQSMNLTGGRFKRNRGL